MNAPFSGLRAFPAQWLRPTVEFLLASQRASGEIPWFDGGHTDPWDHTEAAMGLSVAGAVHAAERAYTWLAETQLEDGSWWACYRDGCPDPSVQRRETNYVAYVATGVWHHFRITQDQQFLERLFPTVVRALDFVLRYQGPDGEIDWAIDPTGAPLGDALMTGCSSIYKSLECGILIEDYLAAPPSGWQDARARLGQALRERPDRFDRTWESKSRYAMDWFYPIWRAWSGAPQLRSGWIGDGMSLWSQGLVVVVRIISLGQRWQNLASWYWRCWRRGAVSRLWSCSAG